MRRQFYAVVQQIQLAGVADAFCFPGFVPAYIRPQFCLGRGPFRWAALSGSPSNAAIVTKSERRVSREAAVAHKTDLYSARWRCA